MSPIAIVLVIVMGYIIGSVPNAYLVAQTKGVNIFKVGSGNMGANNVARACGIQYGALVWVLDGLKGILAVVLARWMLPGYEAVASMLGAVAVVAGHNWSVLATLITGKIRGGKGAATASGTLILLAPTLMVAVVLALATAIVLITRYVSLGGLTAMALSALAFAGLALFGSLEPIYSLYLLIALMVFVRHRTNIVNLLQGRERRLGERT
ncbi:MAG: glycerol-3-phosphate acyltransferase [Chloroflexi bacterium]|nr:glycerol-3-phosphate acyltransferase [Chloroflexota bacterium]